MKNERLSIIVSSKTDASKKTAVMSLRRRTLIFVICAAVLLVVACAGFAAVSLINTLGYEQQLESLLQQEH